MQIKTRSKTRKNFLPSVLLTFFLMLVWAIFFFFVPPEYFGVPILFLVLTFFTVLFPAALIFVNARRGLFTAVFVVLAMILSYFGLGNILNLVLLLGIIVATEYYLSNR